MMAAMNAFARAFWEMPPVTRIYMVASVATTLAVQFEFVSPFQLYFNPKLIYRAHQYWRLFTTFLFFGPLGFNYLFNLVFTYRYCKMLEEEFYRNRTADFFYMFLIGGTLMCMLAYFVNLLFLSHAFTIMLVYIWSRRNPGVRMNFFGLITFQAPYLPWVLLAFSILLGSSTLVDIIGIVVGHFYYFFEDVFPNGPHGFRILETPRLIKYVFDRLGIDEPPFDEDERPEQFDFADRDPQPEAEEQPREPSVDRSQVENNTASQQNSTSNQTSTSASQETNPTSNDRADDAGNGLRARNVRGGTKPLARCLKQVVVRLKFYPHLKTSSDDSIETKSHQAHHS